MVTVRNDISVGIGSSPFDVEYSRVATDNTHPFIIWTLPSDIHQNRFSVKITCVETGAFAYATSGEQITPQQLFQFPTALALNNNFDGLCTCEVAVSQSGQAGADFEYVSAPLYFVFDHSLNRLFNATKLTLTWNVATDPDNQPTDLGRYFHVQVASDPLFTEIDFQNPGVPNLTSSIVTYDVPDNLLVLDTDRTYFFRVRMSDGLDYGDWSKVNAFRNYSQIPPVVTLVSATPVTDSEGDYLITFTMDEASGNDASVELSYTGAGQFARTPCSLISPPIHVGSGTSTVIWRTMRQMSNQFYPDVILYARATDQFNYGPESTLLAPIDNSWMESPSGGIGSDRFTVAISGTISTRQFLSQSMARPVEGSIAIRGMAPITIEKPAALPPYVWRQEYCIGTVDKGSDNLTYNPTDFGWAAQHGDISPVLSWPQIILRSHSLSLGTDPNGSTSANCARVIPTTDTTHWLFRSPVDYAGNSDGWPKSVTARMLDLSDTFLRGYTDASGVEHDYPDFYDWNHRPSWHVGREVYGNGDAWVQIAFVNATHYDVCAICHGKNWLVSSGPPYSHLPCSNTNCIDGFDTTHPLRNGTTHNPYCHPWVDVGWMRLSTWVNGGKLSSEMLFGLSVEFPTVAQSVQHVVGRLPSPLDGNYSYVTTTDGDGNTVVRKTLVDYTMHSDEGPFARKLPAATPVWHPIPSPTNMTSITRQPHAPGGSVYEGLVHVEEQSSSTRSALGGRVILGDKTRLVRPVEGTLGESALPFFMGEDPNSHPAYARRKNPTQVGGGFRIGGTLGRIWPVVRLSFRFLQAYWDAYNTIHWDVTGSETSSMNIQVSQQLEDGTRTDWADVQGDNASLDPTSGHWLTKPLVFDLFWNTSDHGAFPSNGTYQLRIRQYDIKTKSFGSWVYSSPFQIIVGVTNPISIIDTSFEPWKKIITATFRIDDTDQRSYNLTAFSFSIDNGITWRPISLGDISGDMVALSSIPGQNIYSFLWLAAGYDLPATNDCRLRVDCVPTNTTDTITIPLFKWLTPVNPYVDEAAGQLAGILGSTQNRVFNPVTNTWAVANPPVIIPGELATLNQELSSIRTNPSPDGMYSYLAQDQSAGMIVGREWDTVNHYNRYSVSDQPGYTAWLAAPYAGGETHGQALSRVMDTINELVGQEIPALRQTLLGAEILVRKGLMDQGFYAEDTFGLDGEGNVQETITVPANGVQFSNVGSGGIRDVTRWWRFIVQSSAEGPTGVYDVNGNYAPLDLTDLESVRYEFQMDQAGTFDSQEHRTPLRDRLTNYDGNLLAVSAMQRSTSTTLSNPSLDATQSTAPDVGQTTATNPGFGNNTFGVNNPSAENSVTNVGGTLKLPPGDLPGHHPSDVILSPATVWDGDYQWRIAAYNGVTAPLTSRPRPLITSTGTEAGTGLFDVNYTMQAHPLLTTASVTSYTDFYGYRHPTGYQVSHEFLGTPMWAADAAVVWISDHRAPNVAANPSRQINSNDWTWSGTDRRRPCIFHDDEKMLYVGFITKPDPGVSGRYRPVGIRGSVRERLCEYDVYFNDHPALAIYGASLTKVGSTYYLFVTLQQDNVSVPAIYVATSNDCDSWSDLQPTSITVGAYPCIIYDVVSAQFYITYEAPNGAHVQIWTASSTDGITFGTPTVVTSESVDAGSPSALQLNGQWVLYYTAGTDIVSIAGSSLTSLSGRQVERSTFTESSTTFSPMHPCVFMDTFMGNKEVFMAYVAQATSTDHRVRITRLEDRVWVAGIDGKIFAAAGNILDVPSTQDGVARHVAVDAVAHGGPGGNANVKVRFDFTVWTPVKAVYRRQSTWVSQDNVGETGSFMDPPAFTYNHLLDAYPYMGVT